MFVFVFFLFFIMGVMVLFLFDFFFTACPFCDNTIFLFLQKCDQPIATFPVDEKILIKQFTC